MNVKKAEQLADIYGLSLDEMLEMFATDSIVPAICTNPGCDNTEEYEPDCREGYCSSCGRNTVQSLLVLMDMI